MLKLILLVGLLFACDAARVARQAQTSYNICGNTNFRDVRPGDSFRVQSPNYGSMQYSNYLGCSFTVGTSDQPVVLSLTYNAFSVEYASYCNYDALCVNGVKFCGQWPRGQSFQYIVPEYSRFTLSFSTDMSVTDTGFDVTVTAQSVGGGVSEASSGTGSSAGGVNYSTMTYFSSYSSQYSDKCSPNAVSNTSTPMYTTSWPNYNTTYYPWYNTTSWPYYNTTSWPNYNTTYYPWYNTTSWPYYNTTYYPYYNTTSWPYTTYPYYNTTSWPYTTYPYYNTTSWPYYNTTYYPYYNTTSWPYSNTTYYPWVTTTYPSGSNVTQAINQYISEIYSLLSRIQELLRYV